MPRPGRELFEGAVYHVYNRMTRGEPVLANREEAERFLSLLQEVVERDGVTVFAWCIMSNHYHLALRTGVVTLDRPMRSVQQRFTRWHNDRHDVQGPLWQGRYRAKLVKEERYLQKLLAYIHLNPVNAGVARDPTEYPLSGHREILGRVQRPLVDVDRVLRLFGDTRSAARSAYVRALRGAREEQWLGEDPGRLPWWRLGRPPASEFEDPGRAAEEKQDQLEKDEGRERPELSARDLVERGAGALGICIEDLRGRCRAPEVVRARELLATLGVERYGLRVKDLARELGKHAVTASTWVTRGARRRTQEGEFAGKLDDLDRAFASGELD